MQPFYDKLNEHSLKLVRDQTTTLQVNVGLLCNQLCKHCHLEAGPQRGEVMDQATVREVVAYAQRAGFGAVDITGGAPEMNPHLAELIQGVSPLAQRVMLRANLTALGDGRHEDLFDLLIEHQVVVVASMPSVSQSQADAQRGQGVFKRSLDTMARLIREIVENRLDRAAIRQRRAQLDHAPSDGDSQPSAEIRRPFMMRFRNPDKTFSMSLSFRTETEPEPRQVIAALREVIREIETTLPESQTPDP